MKARDISLAGILVSMQVLTLLLIYVIPTIKIALLFATSLYAGVLLRIGVKKSIIAIAYVSSSFLIFFLIQVTDVAVFFVLFFGWYAMLDHTTRDFKMLIQQALRFLAFIIVCVLLYWAAIYLIAIEIDYALWIYALVAIAAFVLMQILFSFCVREFIKISSIAYSDGKISFKK